MDPDEFSERIRAERSIRAQRDAAEAQIPGERLRRGIREAFARADERREQEQALGDAERDPPAGAGADG